MDGSDDIIFREEAPKTGGNEGVINGIVMIVLFLLIYYVFHSLFSQKIFGSVPHLPFLGSLLVAHLGTVIARKALVKYGFMIPRIQGFA